MSYTDLAAFLAIYERVAEVIGSHSRRDVAAALGMGYSGISNLIQAAEGKTLKRGPKNLPYKQLVSWALANGVSIDWLLTGKEPATAEGVQLECPVARAHDPLDRRPPDPTVITDLGMAWSILESKTSTAEALSANVREFYRLVFGGREDSRRGGHGPTTEGAAVVGAAARARKKARPGK